MAVLNVLVFLAISSCGVLAYKPVVIVHGLLSEASHFQELEQHILNVHPGTKLTALNLYSELLSFVPLWTQQKSYLKQFKEISDSSPDGFHLVCHSQGGLVCLSMLESIPNHNVESVVLLGSPMNGQFGITEPLQRYFPHMNTTRLEVSPWMYTFLAQHTISFANYWHDPRPDYHTEYERDCSFLPFVLNDPEGYYYKADQAAIMKAGVTSIKELVLVGGPGDDIITPWQSSHFAFYGSDFEMVEMRDQKLYKEDWFGLRTLDERGVVHLYTVPGVKHTQWHKNKEVFNECIEKYLV